MSGIDKITEKIISDAKAQSEQIIAEAKTKGDKLIEDARIGATSECEAIIGDANKKASNADKLSQSSGELKYRHMVLAEKINILDDMLSQTVNALNNMSEKEYFEVIAAMAVGCAHKGESGLIRFNKRDKDRLPADFISGINSRLGSDSTLVLDKGEADISGGFLLIYGDIEENNSFESVVSSKADELKDTASAMLF